MHIIRARNVHRILPLGLRYLHETGIPMPSRAGDVLVAPGPVTTVYERPQERVLFWPERDANPFLHFFDGLHLLAGRRDVALLTRFAKRMADYSDDGETLHGAYGWRLRRHFSAGDQIEAAIELLAVDPFSRRVVLTMWDTEEDLGRNGRDLPCNTQVYVNVSYGERDRPNRLNILVCNRSNDVIWGCLSGDTPILSPEGNLPIESLARRFTLGLKRYPVYAVEPETGNMSVKWCINAWKTGVKPVIKLHFDDGSHLKLTEDHILFKKKTRGTPKIPTIRIESIRAGDLKIGDRIWAPSPFGLEGYPKIKKNILDNTAFSNIQNIHLVYDELLNGPRPNKMHVHHKDENILNMKAENLERLPISEHMSFHMRNKMQAMNKEDRISLAKKASDASKQAFENMSEEERQNIYDKMTKGASERMTAYWAAMTEEEKRYVITQKSLAARDKVSKEQRKELGRKGSASRWSDPEQHIRQSNLMKKLRSERKINHVIIKIEYLPPEEVYDFSVEDYHSALVGNGVLAHNCYGANAVQFSMLQEYMATRLGLDIGLYHQVSNNYHAYQDIYVKIKRDDLHLWNPSWNTDPYERGEVTPYPMVTEPLTWDAELARFLDDPTAERAGWKNPFFPHVARPLWLAHAEYKAKSQANALVYANSCAALDWSRAALEWLQRREEKGRDSNSQRVRAV